MKKMTLSLAFSVSSAANAVLIDEDTFRKYGGNFADKAGSIPTATRRQQVYSYARPWLVAGRMPGSCAATWLGDKEGWKYFLTAAHCVEYREAETFVLKIAFQGWDGKSLADAHGTIYVPPERINAPKGLSDKSNDIAIVRVRSNTPTTDRAGAPLERPILNDLQDEDGKPVIFVGIGTWGVGLDHDPDYSAFNGDRRLYGRSKTGSLLERGYSLGAPYDPRGPSEYWARVASDGGSAWWQFHGTRPVIVATTTRTGYSMFSIGTRVSKYAGWIRSIYPEARFLSETHPQGCIVSRKNKAKYCIELGQAGQSHFPDWIRGHGVHVEADPGVTVSLSDMEEFSESRMADFNGTVENSRLRKVKANNGQYLNFSRPKSMRVTASTTALGCIVSLETGEKYCLKAGDRSGYRLPDWIKGQEVFVHADPGAAVMLSDWDNLSYNRVAVFNGVVQNENLKRVKAYSGEVLNFSRPFSMRVVQH